MRSFLAAIALVAVLSAVAVSGASVFTGGKVTALPNTNFTLSSDQYAGYITVDEETNGQLFFWFFESQNDPANDPVVLWMTGGPGCSSELAVLFENGPYRISEEITAYENIYSWNKIANVIYIDQPFGVGFSPIDAKDPITDEAEVAVEVFDFLTNWFASFPSFADNDFVITGESYGGHYVPAVSSYLVQQIEAGKSDIKFTGAAIGNGWVNPYIQYNAYAPFAYMNNLIGEETYAQLNATYKQCAALLDAGNYTAAENVCNTIMEGVLEVAGNINVYNIDLPCIGELCYDFSNQTSYMNQANTKAALYADASIEWNTCDPSDITNLDIISSFEDDVANVLNAGYPVLIYNGMLDLICNWVGAQMWTPTLEWTYQTEWNAVPLEPYKMNGAEVGLLKSAHNLTFFAVAGAGHMVPHDQPEVALNMLDIFLSGGDFNNNA